MNNFVIALTTVAALNVSFNVDAHEERFKNQHCEINLSKDITWRKTR